mgnify:CR=1 FL=1
MRQSTLKAAALFLCIGALSPKANSQSSNETINVVTSAVPFLRISPDAAAGGMGDVGIATASDANSSFWNLAKTPFAKQKGRFLLQGQDWAIFAPQKMPAERVAAYSSIV